MIPCGCGPARQCCSRRSANWLPPHRRTTRLPGGRCCVAHGEEFSNMLLVEVAGRPLPADIAGRLVSGYVDDSSNVPDLFVLRFSDEYSTVLDKAGISIGV